MLTRCNPYGDGPAIIWTKARTFTTLELAFGSNAYSISKLYIGMPSVTLRSHSDRLMCTLVRSKRPNATRS